MQKTHIIKIPGKPISKKRPRFSAIKSKSGVYKGTRTYNSQQTEEGKFLLFIHQYWKDMEPLSGPLIVDTLFIFPRPKSHFGTGKNEGKLKASAPAHHVVKPDRDNLDKFPLDCMNGVVYVDDCQIFDGNIKKRYCFAGEQPMTVIIIREA